MRALQSIADVESETRELGQLGAGFGLPDRKVNRADDDLRDE